MVAAILGVGGVVGGAAAGAALEKDSTTGLPADELFVYKDALKQGRSVIFVEARDDDEAAKAHAVLPHFKAVAAEALLEEGAGIDCALVEGDGRLLNFPARSYR